MKKLLFILFLLPVFAYAQVPVIPQWQMDKTKDSIGFTIPGVSGVKWIWDSRLNRIRLLQKSDTATLVVTQTALKDTLNAHGAIAGDGINFVGNTVNAGGALSNGIYFSGRYVKADTLKVNAVPDCPTCVLRLTDTGAFGRNIYNVNGVFTANRNAYLNGKSVQFTDNDGADPSFQLLMAKKQFIANVNRFGLDGNTTVRVDTTGALLLAGNVSTGDSATIGVSGNGSVGSPYSAGITLNLSDGLQTIYGDKNTVGWKINDDRGSKGASYPADYSAVGKLDDGWLTPWGAVKGAIDSLHTVISGSIANLGNSDLTQSDTLRTFNIGSNRLLLKSDSTFVSINNDGVKVRKNFQIESLDHDYGGNYDFINIQQPDFINDLFIGDKGDSHYGIKVFGDAGEIGLGASYSQPYIGYMLNIFNHDASGYFYAGGNSIDATGQLLLSNTPAARDSSLKAASTKYVDDAIAAGVGGTVSNASNLNSHPGSYYLDRSNHTGTQAWSTITSTPTTKSGYGITDVVAYSDTATMLGNVVHINKAETILGPKTMAQILTINLNTGVAAPSLAFPGQTALQVNGLDGQTNVSEYNTNGHVLIEGWKYNGTAGSKTGLVANDEIIAFGGGGWYDATHRTAEAAGALQFIAGETWSSSANGSYATLKVTKNATTTLSTAQQWNNDFSSGIIGNLGIDEATVQNPAGYTSRSIAELYGSSTNSANPPTYTTLANVAITSGTVGEFDFQSNYNSSGSYGVARMFAQLTGSTTNNKGGNFTVQTKKDGGSYTTGWTMDNLQKSTFSPTGNASSGTDVGFTINSTVSQTSTAAYTDFLVNRTTNTPGSGAQNLFDFQVGGVSKGSLSSTGTLTLGGSVAAGKYDGNISALATTAADGGVFTNRTAATSGVPVQIGPRIRTGGRVWNLSGTPASNEFDFGMEARGVSASTPTATLYWMSSLVTNTTPSFTDRMSLDNSGLLSVTHLSSITSAPTIAAGTGAGTSPTVTVTGSDLGHQVNVTTGTSPTATATVATITFNVAYGSAPKAVVLTPANSVTAALNGTAQVYVDASSTTTTVYVIKVGSGGLAASTAYQWMVQVIQ